MSKHRLLGLRRARTLWSRWAIPSAGVLLTGVSLGLALLLISCAVDQARHPDSVPSGSRTPAAHPQQEVLSRLRLMGYMTGNGSSYAEQDVVHNTEHYDVIDEDGFLDVVRHPLSTFSIDVDTASYSNVRRMLREGRLPPPGAVRIEEFLNYFPYAYSGPGPAEEAPFAVESELADAPWAPGHQLLKIALQGRRIEAREIPPRNLTFLIDVSGSMWGADRLPLVRRALGELVRTLRPEDRVALVVYAGASGLVLPPTSGAEQERILGALAELEAGGSTNGGEGIVLAYDTASRYFDKDGINRVILATDGDFNVGVSDRSRLVELIEEKRASGVFLTVLGVGRGNLQDATMEELADRGNGHYAYIDSLAEARKVLIGEAGGTLVTIAKDVKIQLEFNPARIAAYRLIGYENRRLADEDFNDDTQDAGEIGAGHSVTALYEVVPVGVPIDSGEVDPLRYQRPAADVEAWQHGDELATLKLRYKEPDREESQLLVYRISEPAVAFERASEDLRFAASVTAFAMLLRDSPFRGDVSWGQTASWARDALGSDRGGYRREFARLVEVARELSTSDGVDLEAISLIRR